MSNIDYEALKGFANTKRQTEIIQSLIDQGSQRKAAQALGVHHKCVSRVVDICRRSAAKHGFAPGHFNSGTAPGYQMGKVTIQRGGKGEIERVWERQHPEAQAQLEAIREWSEWLREDFKGLAPAKPRKSHTDSDIMCVYPMGDPHFGLYSWAEETGEDFDLKEADRRTREVVDRLVASAPASKTALFINLGDMMHADDTTNRTPASGHTLDVDTRFGMVVQVALRAMIYCIERMREKHQKVIYWHEVANHDPHSGYMLALCLNAYYHDAKDVDINLSPAFYHYMRFGKVLIGATHGHGPKENDLPLIMAHDRKEDWGVTDFRYWYVGHFHHKSAKEHPGVIVEKFRTLTGSDAWHASKGYRSGKDMVCITLHKDYGEIQRTTCPLSVIN